MANTKYYTYGKVKHNDNIRITTCFFIHILVFSEFLNII